MRTNACEAFRDNRHFGFHRLSLDRQIAVDSFYDQAREMGVNVIIRLDAQRVTEDIQDGVRVGYQASGFAINRKGN